MPEIPLPQLYSQMILLTITNRLYYNHKEQLIHINMEVQILVHHSKITIHLLHLEHIITKMQTYIRVKLDHFHHPKETMALIQQLHQNKYFPIMIESFRNLSYIQDREL